MKGVNREAEEPVYERGWASEAELPRAVADVFYELPGDEKVQERVQRAGANLDEISAAARTRSPWKRTVRASIRS